MSTQITLSTDDFRVLFEHLPDATLLIDPYDPYVEWAIVACNRAICRMNGYAVEEMIGQPVEMLNLRPLPPGERAAFLDRIRTEGTLYGRYDFRRKDATIIPTEYSSSFVVIDGRELIISTFRDVSDPIQTEAALHDSDLRLRLLADQLPAVLWTTDHELCLTSSSGAGLREINQLIGNITGVTIYELFQTQDLQSPPVHAHLEALKGQSMEYQADLLGLVFEAHVEPFFNNDGEIIGCIGVGLDITKRVQAEASFRTIFEESPTGMMIIDLAYRFQRVNRAFSAILGYTEQELAGMSVSDVTHPEDVEDSVLFARQLLAGIRPDYTIEKRYITKQRKVIWGRTTSTLLRDNTGQALAGLGIIENITGRKRSDLLLEAERRRVAYELHDSLAQVLASTHFRLQALASRYRPRAPEARADLDQALELAQRAVREARRIIAGLRPTALDDFGLATALQKEVEALTTAGWDISFECKLDGQHVPSAAETALFWVAQEALTNIRKHAGQTHVRISLGIEDSDICLEIQDWGRGFDPGAPTTHRGLGEQIGLLGMQERVAVLGGLCEVHSQPGAGTKIVAQVPLALPSAEEGIDVFSFI